MTAQAVSEQTSSGTGRPSQSASPSGLPDVNKEITPYDVVQYLLDQTANFSMFAVPDERYANAATLTPGHPEDWFGLNGGYGIDFVSSLHPFGARVKICDRQQGLNVDQAVGESAGRMHCRCLFSPSNFQWAPKGYPPPWIFDPWNSQQFVVQECEFTFGDSHQVTCYGIGRTFPLNINGRPVLLASAVGNIMGGTGKFQGRQGTFVWTGNFTSSLGFLGQISLRVLDAEGTLRTESEESHLTGIPDPDPGDTFVTLRLIKKNKNVRTSYGPPPGGSLVSLVTPSEMRSVDYGYIATRGPRAVMSVGQAIGPMQATVFFDLQAPPGTAEAPVPFTTQELYTFVNGNGETIGTISAAVVKGISFGLRFPAAPQQPGVRFAGFGPIQGGTGPFAGAQGMLTVNSLIGISPHALSLMHVLHIVDPNGRFRSINAGPC
jgi:hypothetical protein